MRIQKNFIEKLCSIYQKFPMSLWGIIITQAKKYKPTKTITNKPSNIFRITIQWGIKFHLKNLVLTKTKTVIYKNTQRIQ